MCFLAFRVLHLSLYTRSLFKLLHHDSLLATTKKKVNLITKLNQSYFREFVVLFIELKKEKGGKKQDAVVDGTNVMKRIHHHGNERN